MAGHTVARLQAMKQQHEERIELLTAIGADRHSHVLLYGAKIGEHASHLSLKKAAAAMIPDHYPAEHRAFEIGLGRSEVSDAEASYWPAESVQLRRQFASLVRPRLAANEVAHLSIFALAPIPLLIELGRLLSDIPATDVFQLHREPADWKWKHDPVAFKYNVLAPIGVPRKTVALVLALSANVVPSRVEAVLGDDVDIWIVTHDTPGNDYLQSAVQLREFRRTLRDVFDSIKAAHGEDANLHLFPAVPVSAAVEVGRVWMPKADLPFCVYDQNCSTGGFTRTLEIR
jgi:hypothetical protein